jgi:hypothetical protein
MADERKKSTRVIRAKLQSVGRLWFLATHDGVRVAVTPEECNRSALIGVETDWALSPQRRGDPRAVPVAAHLRRGNGRAPGARRNGSAVPKHDSEDLTKPRRRVIKIDATGKRAEKTRVCAECQRNIPVDDFPNPAVRRCGPCGGTLPPRSIRTISGGLPGLGKRR